MRDGPTYPMKHNASIWIIARATPVSPATITLISPGFALISRSGFVASVIPATWPAGPTIRPQAARATAGPQINSTCLLALGAIDHPHIVTLTFPCRLHMQQLLRAGPHLPRPRRQPAAAQALQGLPPNGYRHPAMDLLLLHACGASSTSAPLAHNALEHTGSGAAAGAGALLRSPAGPAWAGAGTLDGTGKGDDAGAGGPGASAFNRAAGQLGQGLGLPHPHELLQRGLAEPLQDRVRVKSEQCVLACNTDRAS